MLNDINFLVTHHPADWLSPHALEEFQSSVFVPDYFDAHLFGHMHDNLPSEQTIGAHKSRIFQAASLFWPRESSRGSRPTARVYIRQVGSRK